ncbi:MAG: zinc dependent phospholipase C family protein [Solobacterium sp.]|nr:zinc dependent phospholipase C family protein [Solobacterium sp.]
MPSATTHALFAKELLERLPELRKSIDRPELFYIGTQGPDVMFFSRYSFLPGSLHWLGGKMHREKTKELLFFLKDYTDKHPLLKSYYYGFIAHYALDSVSHPLIIWASQEEEERYGRSHNQVHYRNEGDIDLWALKHTGLTIHDYDVHRLTKLNKEEAEALADLLMAAASTVYGDTITRKDTLEAIDGVSRISRLIRPGSELRYRIVFYAEKLMKWPHNISGMMIMHKHDHGLIVFNEDHTEYNPPGRPGERDSRSFEEVYADALDFGERIILDLKPEHIHYDFDGNAIQ